MHSLFRLPSGNRQSGLGPALATQAHPQMNRREFLHASGVSASALVVGRRLAARGWQAYEPLREPLRIGLIARPQSALFLGVQLGVEEARHAAALFGGDVVLTTADSGSGRGDPAAASEMMHREHVIAVIGGADAETCAAIADACERRGRIHMNVGCTDDVLRGARCHAHAFHVAASERMARDARAQAHAGPAAAVMLWDPALKRFGAGTLNERFRARFSRAMTASAWAGWFAVKVLWEASLRERSSQPAGIARYLSSTTTQFDGHKGRPLSFRAWDHQLRQPLYVRSGEGTDATIVEVPVPRGNESSREGLDRLGAGARQSACSMSRHA